MQTDVFISMDCQHMFGHPNQHRPKYRVPICGQFGYFDLGLCHSYWCYTGHLFSHLYRCPIKFHQDPSKLIMLYDSGGSSQPQHSMYFFTKPKALERLPGWILGCANRDLKRFYQSPGDFKTVIKDF